MNKLLESWQSFIFDSGVYLQQGANLFPEQLLTEIRSGAAEGGGWGEEFRRALALSTTPLRGAHN